MGFVECRGIDSIVEICDGMDVGFLEGEVDWKIIMVEKNLTYIFNGDALNMLNSITKFMLQILVVIY